ncbi:MAG: Holliday junction resolvase RuvX [Erysipelotrichaceae bacterium]|nr:Holliday junction resolvase RuvX [Erysipelotrichaceae bacterium]MDD3808838.1 Holliday junction resolvase RuvX [Erysipelotrichaceae bacterium]
MKKILGLDLGSRTCGIAMSDSLGMLAHGVETYRFKDGDYQKPLERVMELVKENGIEEIVLGYPKHMNNDEGIRCQISRDFKVMLEEAIPGIKVILKDERLTTKIAQDTLIFADVSRKKRKEVIDKMAAVAILQGYLDSLR